MSRYAPIGYKYPSIMYGEELKALIDKNFYLSGDCDAYQHAYLMMDEINRHSQKQYKKLEEENEHLKKKIELYELKFKLGE
jgi:hypothetical protein